jgi:hypothetical protein
MRGMAPETGDGADGERVVVCGGAIPLWHPGWGWRGTPARQGAPVAFASVSSGSVDGSLWP